MLTMRAALRPMPLMRPLRTPPMSDVMAMTAAMPITMPRMVRRLRPLLASSDLNASRQRSAKLIGHLPGSWLMIGRRLLRRAWRP